MLILLLTLLGVLSCGGATHHTLHLLQLVLEPVDQVGYLLLTDFLGDEVQGVPLFQVVYHFLGRRLCLHLPQLHLVVI